MANGRTSSSLISGAFLGGAVAFAWTTISWLVLPWHAGALRSFRDESAVAQAIVANAPRAGVYFLPNPPPERSSAPPAAAEAARDAALARMERGPVLFAAVRPRGAGSVTRAMVIDAAIDILGALLFTWLLLQTKGLSYWRRVAFVATAALAVAVVAALPDWNWLGFSAQYTAIVATDMVLGWSLAGLVIARVT
jgi:hypothetical protein